jgi:membrane fusion protein
MQNIVELKTEETNAVVGSLMVKREGPLQQIARLFVPTRAIGKVRTGQTASIRYDAFPYQKYGTFSGRIENVSNSVILPQEVEKVSPVKLTEPAYVLDVAIRRQSVMLGGDREAALRPDMLLTATIETDQRTILAWIGESVFGVAQR